MKRLPRLLMVLFVLASFSVSAQAESPGKIDVNNDVDVVLVYEQVVIEGYGTPFIYEELANAYYFKNEHLKAKKWYEKLFDTKETSDPTLKHRYRQTLKALDLEYENNKYLALGGAN